jgi:hypothetical protein
MSSLPPSKYDTLQYTSLLLSFVRKKKYERSGIKKEKSCCDLFSILIQKIPCRFDARRSFSFFEKDGCGHPLHTQKMRVTAATQPLSRRVPTVLCSSTPTPHVRLSAIVLFLLCASLCGVLFGPTFSVLVPLFVEVG